MTVRIGTRGSQLALWQARTVAGLLEARGTHVEIVTIRTTGDRLQDQPAGGPPAPSSDGKGVFVKELEDALRSHVIDAAVHSAKDMSAVLPDDLVVAAVLPREDARDALVVREGSSGGHLNEIVARLGPAPAVGTSSVRRTAQLTGLIPGARFAPVRGNVDTRLRKLDGGEFDAIVLAVAGMKRLGFSARISGAIPHADCIPAPGQGIVAVETRADDGATRALASAIGDPPAATCFEAERALVAALGGGCQLPLGAIATFAGTGLHLQAVVASVDGSRRVRRERLGAAHLPAELGRRLADELASAGAAAILDEVR